MGETPLHKAVFLHIDVHYRLEGEDPNVKNVRNRTAIQCADEDIREITEWSPVKAAARLELAKQTFISKFLSSLHDVALRCTDP